MTFQMLEMELYQEFPSSSCVENLEYWLHPCLNAFIHPWRQERKEQFKSFPSHTVHVPLRAEDGEGGAHPWCVVSLRLYTYTWHHQMRWMRKDSKIKNPPLISLGNCDHHWHHHFSHPIMTLILPILAWQAKLPWYQLLEINALSWAGGNIPCTPLL